MKKLFLLLVLLIVSLNYIYSQPNKDVLMIENDVVEKTIDGECITLRLDLGKKLIVLDCPDYDYYDLDWNKSSSIETSTICLGRDCFIEVDIYFNGELIDHQRIHKENEVAHYSVDYEYLKNLLGDNYTGDTANIVIKITKFCYDINAKDVPTLISFPPVIEEIPIQIRNAGDMYQVDLIVSTGVDYLCEELYSSSNDLKEISVCCTGEFEMDVTLQNISGEKLTVRGTVSLGVNGTDGFSKTGVSIDYVNEAYKISNFITTRSITVSKEANGEECFYPGIQLNLNKHEIWEMEVMCYQPDNYIQKLDEYEEVYGVQKLICSYETDCEEKDPNPYFDDEGYYRLFAGNCLGNINVELQNPVSGMHYEYLWEGPEGTLYNTQNLTGVPYGLYQLTIHDACCNEYNYIYNLCDQKNYGPWYYSNGEYCREVTCDCDDIIGLRENETYTMCVTPHRYDDSWSFDLNIKKCTRHAYWTGQDGMEIDLTSEVGEDDIEQGDGNVVKEPIVEDHYDNITKQCVRDYYCEEGIPVGTSDFGLPTSYGFNWSFNNFDNRCYRDVYCFNESEPVPQQDYEDADISWTFDLTSGLCEATVFCDGSEMYGAYVTPHYPYYESDWLENQPTFYECKKTVSCEYGETEEVVVQWRAEYMGYTDYCINTYGEETGHQYDYYCGDEFVRTQCATGGRNSNSLSNTNDLDRLSKENIILFPNPTDNDINISIKSDIGGTIFLDILTLSGKILKHFSSQISEGENTLHIDDLESIKSGMYFIHLYDNKEISHQYKIVKK